MIIEYKIDNIFKVDARADAIDDTMSAFSPPSK